MAASSINVVTISGNITQDSQLRHTQSGAAVLNFSVAVNQRQKQKDGTWGDRVSYIDCVMFGARAESLAQWLTTGTHVVVSGELRQTRWEDANGNKHSRVEITVGNVEFQSKRRSEQPTPQPQPPTQQQTQHSQPVASAPQPTQQAPELYDEEIPF